MEKTDSDCCGDGDCQVMPFCCNAVSFHLTIGAMAVESGNRLLTRSYNSMVLVCPVPEKKEPNARQMIKAFFILNRFDTGDKTDDAGG